MSETLSQTFSSLQQLVQHFESGGNYAAVNPTSSASGAYQFTTPTWQQYAGQIGVNLNQWPTAASAPPQVQDEVFGQAVSSSGLSDWICPGCDPALTNYLNANPSAANLPTFASGSSSPATSQGAQPAAKSASDCSWWNPSCWFTDLGNWLESVAARAGLFILAILFILGAIVLFGIKSGIEIETGSSS